MATCAPATAAIGELDAVPQRPPRVVRRYGSSDIARIRFIESAQRLGFALQDVADLLRLDDGGACSVVRLRAEGKLQEVRSRLTDLRKMERARADLVKRCAISRGTVRCPRIASLSGPTGLPAV